VAWRIHIRGRKAKLKLTGGETFTDRIDEIVRCQWGRDSEEDSGIMANCFRYYVTVTLAVHLTVDGRAYLNKYLDKTESVSLRQEGSETHIK
jgi:hypothetical protein